MKDYDLKRRKLLRLLMSLPVGIAVGCDLEPRDAGPQTPPLSPEESLRKLVLALGPWSDTDKTAAERFARRFLAAEHMASPYLPGASEVVQSLASRFPAEAIAWKEINLQNLPAKERELLLKLVKQLYSLIEVRFLVCNEPQYGSCQTDRMMHTRAPMSGKI